MGVKGFIVNGSSGLLTKRLLMCGNSSACYALSLSVMVTWRTCVIDTGKKCILTRPGFDALRRERVGKSKVRSKRNPMRDQKPEQR
jgi:hypothetical protein